MALPTVRKNNQATHRRSHDAIYGSYQNKQGIEFWIIGDTLLHRAAVIMPYEHN